MRPAGRGPRLDDPPRRRRQPAARRHASTGDGCRQELAAERRAVVATRSTPLEDPAGLEAILGRQYHAVVGNPPYITVKDAALNAAYRDAGTTCHRQVRARRAVHRAVLRPRPRRATDGRPAGFVGMITANSFMKREFGKKLIEEFFPTIDLTHVIDTSGAYIPGHGTPTVILFGRNREPVGDDGARRAGHPGRAEHARRSGAGAGLAVDRRPDRHGQARRTSSSAWRTCRGATFGKHPWSIGGGGAAELKERSSRSRRRQTASDRRLRSASAHSHGEDDAVHAPIDAVGRRHSVERACFELVDRRDASATGRSRPSDCSLCPIRSQTCDADPIDRRSALTSRALAVPNHACERERRSARRRREHGLPWYEYCESLPNELQHPAVDRLRLRRHAQPLRARPGRQGVQAARPRSSSCPPMRPRTTTSPCSGCSTVRRPASG